MAKVSIAPFWRRTKTLGRLPFKLVLIAVANQRLSSGAMPKRRLRRRVDPEIAGVSRGGPTAHR